MTEELQPTLNELDPKARRIRREIKKQVISYITAAFGLITGLAWNDAIKNMIETLVPLKQKTMMAKFMYALIITLVLVLVTSYLAEIIRDDSEEKEAEKVKS